MVRIIAGVPLVASPIRLDGEGAAAELAPPSLGEHTNELLARLGLSSAQAERLRRDGVVD
jgi:crotonobetainyl-CoA:carnitine CoA-transferase CaiB-like acyl-CoA transferase